jgi:hypothetical protein
MTTRETSFAEILYPREKGISDTDWARVAPMPRLVAVFPNFGREMLAALQKDLKTSSSGLLQMTPLDILQAGWKKYREVAKALEDSKQKPAEPLYKPLLDHTIKSVHHPYIDLVLEETPVWKVVFDLTAALEVQGASLKIQNGQVMEILTGTCQASLQLACGGQLLKQAKTNRFTLPGTLPLRPSLVISQPAHASASEPESAPAPGPSTPAGARPHLTALSGALAGQVFFLSDGAVIGRSGENSIPLPDPSVSRQHARLRMGPNQWFIQDLDSAAGTRVNGKRVGAIALRNGDQICIGSYEFEFHG